MSPSSATIPAPNRPAVSLSTINDAQGDAPWSHRLIENAQSYADLLCERPGTVSPALWRPNADELVAILEGRYEVEIEDLGTFQGATWTGAAAINDAGQIVGNFSWPDRTHTFL